MSLIKKILHRFDGLHYPQEYLCFAKESFHHLLHAYLVSGGKIIKDITSEHLFTGYSPLIFTLFAPADDTRQLPVDIDIYFWQRSFQQNDSIEKKDAIAILSLRLIRTQLAGEMKIFHYQGIRGEHHFLSLFHQFIIGLNNRFYNKIAGNVFLKGNLYKQVQIAYSIPRSISLVTVGKADQFNLFPSDLNGPAGNDHFIISLRHEGKACQQVESWQRILICEVQADACKLVYGLGKNHMQDPKPRLGLPFGEFNSMQFNLPIPEAAVRYRELELQESLVQGIHKILLFKSVSSQEMESADTLAHIHNSYATWRHNNRLPGNYILR